MDYTSNKLEDRIANTWNFNNLPEWPKKQPDELLQAASNKPFRFIHAVAFVAIAALAWCGWMVIAYRQVYGG